MPQYIHGYTPRESQRLREQSGILENLLHEGVLFPPGSRVLEAGCGVGAQTVILSRHNPEVDFISIDRSAESLEQARKAVEAARQSNVEFRQADIMNLDFPEEAFDHVFVCFVLEHLDDPAAGLLQLRRVLKPGGTLTAIEGDHGSCFWHPETAKARAVWEAMIKVQQFYGHDPLIGRTLHPLLKAAGFEVRDVVPRPAYVDGCHPEIRQGALSKILVPMAQTAREKALEMNLISAADWDQGISEYARVGEAPEGTLFYTWFRGVGVKPAPSFPAKAGNPPNGFP